MQSDTPATPLANFSTVNTARPTRISIHCLWLLACLFMVFTNVSSVQASESQKLKIGVTLHPYYSWVANIAGDTVELSTIIPENFDPHSYQSRPQDLENLAKLDAIVVNTLGHDDYVEPMLKAVGKEDIIRIKPNEGLPLIPAAGRKVSFGKEDNKVSYNSHTYVSIISAAQQINTVAEGLARLNPQYKELYRKNSRQYIKKLRGMLRTSLKSLDKDKANHLSIATVHDGYAYLFQELGIKVDAVIQPRHGIEPSARQLADTIKRINKAKANVLFTETDYKKKYVDTIFQETGCAIYKMSHISNGPYTADKFEKDMEMNLNAIITAINSANGE